jgi:putative ABC transport system permease protein
VFAVGTTFGLIEQMVPQMDFAHHSTFPSHGTLYLTKPVDLATIESLRKTTGLEDLDPINSIEIRYKLRPEAVWKKCSILMRDYALQEYDLLQLKAGEWPDGENLGIERMHAPFYGIDIDDQVIIEVGNSARSFPITGKIRHPFVPPPSMYDWAWFFSGEEIMEKFGIPPGTYTAQI